MRKASRSFRVNSTQREPDNSKANNRASARAATRCGTTDRLYSSLAIVSLKTPMFSYRTRATSSQSSVSSPSTLAAILPENGTRVPFIVGRAKKAGT
ncbi:DUF1330 domain-containing protein [Colletotrichum scovillei]|uniref:DUF1330 domain-containing protein n=1 Tax=Colletotrichum scovillei TaxID=1209932 RepID=A0A9P7RA07_9PEZI|nr:DUF1330 domain-containing protein [Colletotrichum scovillei]KAG7071964.1 DUF1330 domain-containing protein [Colletotrichum scovillei]KAG7080306.1 DUF1330 domain-containing protein [Colletotrichum scovillei]